MSKQSERKRNLVIIGMKPIMNYVVACLTLFNSGAEIITVRARGKHINKAVDAVELLRRIFLKDAIVKDIRVDTDTLKRKDGREAKVSIIEIMLSQKQ